MFKIGGTVVTPALKEHSGHHARFLPGFAQVLGVPVEERRISIQELFKTRTGQTGRSLRYRHCSGHFL